MIGDFSPRQFVLRDGLFYTETVLVRCMLKKMLLATSLIVRF